MELSTEVSKSTRLVSKALIFVSSSCIVFLIQNLDVNLAVNNLLSRDDEGDDEGESCEAYMSGKSVAALLREFSVGVLFLFQ
jgi:hypothetical protein